MTRRLGRDLALGVLLTATNFVGTSPLWARAMVPPALAQESRVVASATVARRAGARVSGVVRDSLTDRPLAHAIVQLVDSAGEGARTATSDTLGRFTLDDVPEGHYLLGFFHPVLDSLGIEAPARTVHVERGQAVRVDLAIPSAARVRRAICSAAQPGATSSVAAPLSSANASDAGAVLIGVVRNASDGKPAVGTTVAVEWMEMSISPGGVSRHTARLAARVTENGWYALCDVPRPGFVSLVADHESDSTDVLDLEMPMSGFMRQDLFVGSARTVTTDSTVGVSRAGSGRVSGTVLTDEGGWPIAGAEVRIVGGPRTRTNDKGEWTLTDAPVGTRMLEVRAIRYYPDRRPVAVVTDGAPVRVTMNTLRAVLDTVRVKATRKLNRDMGAFELRRKNYGIGRFFTQRDIALRHPMLLSDLFRSIPGMRVEHYTESEKGLTLIQLHGSFNEWCEPAIYLDGQYMGEMSAEDVDDWIKPSRVAGIEIYAGAIVPPEFSRGMQGPSCGSVVIWRK